jgi:uncharacterized membrane protein (UPF0136 family)
LRKKFLQDQHVAASWHEAEASNSKLQIPKKIQIPKAPKNLVGSSFEFVLKFPCSLGVGVWDLLRNWTVWKCWSTDAAHIIMGAAKIYFIVFGILTIAGGVIGYVKAGSVPSIIAGAIAGILLLAAAFLLPDYRVVGLALGLVTSLLLAGQFIPKFIRTGKVMPAGMMSILSVIGIVMAIVAWTKK